MEDNHALKTDEKEPLGERIEAAFDGIYESRATMDRSLRSMRESEQRVKSENGDEYKNAKNNEVRQFLLADWLAGDEDYEAAREDYERARLDLRLSQIEAERLKLLVRERASHG